MTSNHYKHLIIGLVDVIIAICLAVYFHIALLAGVAFPYAFINAFTLEFKDKEYGNKIDKEDIFATIIIPFIALLISILL